jgi:hypothetical protein
MESGIKDYGYIVAGFAKTAISDICRNDYLHRFQHLKRFDRSSAYISFARYIDPVDRHFWWSLN